MAAYLNTDINSEFAHDFAAGAETKADKALLVKFYDGVERDLRKEEGYFESRYDERDGREYQVRIKGTGRPEFRNVPCIEIRVPGDKDNVVNGPAWIDPDERHPKAHNVRFAAHWKAFLAKREQPLEGTPIDELPFLTPADRESLKAEKFQTAEHIVAAPDTVAQRMAGFQNIKNRVKAYLEAMTGAAPTMALTAAVKAQEERNSALTSEIDLLKKQLAEMAKGKGK